MYVENTERYAQFLSKVLNFQLFEAKMNITLNGKKFHCQENQNTLESLLLSLGLSLDSLIIEHNGEIVASNKWADTLLGEGDVLEIVHFVGGG